MKPSGPRQAPRPLGTQKKYLSVRRVYTHPEEVFEALEDEEVIHVDDEDGDLYIYLLRKREQHECEIRL